MAVLVIWVVRPIPLFHSGSGPIPPVYNMLLVMTPFPVIEVMETVIWPWKVSISVFHGCTLPFWPVAIISPSIQVVGSAQCSPFLLSPQLLLLPSQLLTLTHNALLFLAPFTLHSHALPLQSLPLQPLPF